MSHTRLDSGTYPSTLANLEHRALRGGRAPSYCYEWQLPYSYRPLHMILYLECPPVVRERPWLAFPMPPTLLTGPSSRVQRDQGPRQIYSKKMSPHRRDRWSSEMLLRQVSAPSHLEGKYHLPPLRVECSNEEQPMHNLLHFRESWWLLVTEGRILKSRRVSRHLQSRMWRISDNGRSITGKHFLSTPSSSKACQKT